MAIRINQLKQIIRGKLQQFAKKQKATTKMRRNAKVSKQPQPEWWEKQEYLKISKVPWENLADLTTRPRRTTPLRTTSEIHGMYSPFLGTNGPYKPGLRWAGGKSRRNLNIGRFGPILMAQATRHDITERLLRKMQ